MRQNSKHSQTQRKSIAHPQSRATNIKKRTRLELAMAGIMGTLSKGCLAIILGLF